MVKLGSPLDFGAYASKSMAAYLLLSVPAVVLEVLFSFSIASSPNLSGVNFFGLTQLVPWLVIAASVYAMLTFRSSLLLSLLVLGYFFSSVVAQTSALVAAGLVLDAGTAATLVVVSAFLALMAFGFARSARIQSGRKAVLRSRGSLPFQVLGFSLDFAVPAVLAVVLVLVTTGIFNAVKSTLEALPPPLSGIFTSGLSSPFAAVGVTLIVAGVTLWTVRELVEPVVLYYSITKEDAVKLLLSDLEVVAKTVERRHKRNLKGGAATALVVGGIVGLLLSEFGPSATLGQLPTLWGGTHPASYPSFTIQTNNAFNQLERTIEAVIKLLWG